MVDSCDDALHEVEKRLKNLAMVADNITEASLQKIYKSDSIFGERANPSLPPTMAKTWFVLIRADNKIENAAHRNNSVERVRRVIGGLTLFEVDELPRPNEDNAYRPWLEAIQGQLDAYTSAVRKYKSVSANVIQSAFGLGERDLQTSNLLPGRYYGYRRSGASGDIVRFSFEIADDPNNPKLLRFENLYSRHHVQWQVSGVGFALGEVSHFIGTARSNEPSLGKGVRFFTLQRYTEFGWIVGLLETRDTRDKPIAARVVLVPAVHHKTGSGLAFDLAEPAFTEFLEQGADLKKLPLEIDVGENNKRLLRGLTEADVLQSLIWNGSLRALHGEPQPIPSQNNHVGLRRLIEIQNRVLALGTQPANDAYAFMRLLSSSPIFAAVDNLLKTLEGAPRHPFENIESFPREDR